jgi:hypothetical protein
MPFCDLCGKAFVKDGKCLKNHISKCNGNLPKVFGFSESFFVNSSNEDLDEAFIDDDMALLSDFQKRTMPFLSCHKNEFSVSVLNINSIGEKFHEIAFLLHRQLLDILVINESKIDEHFDTKRIENVNYNFINRPRTKMGGGVIMYINKSIKIVSINTDPTMEIIKVVIQVNGQTKFAVFGCYRSEKFCDQDEFLACLDANIESVSDLVDHVIVAGDFNYNMIGAKGLPNVEVENKITSIITDNGLVNTINEPTRLNKKTGLGTLIDLILVTCMNLFVASMVFDFERSDHALIVSVFNLKSKPNSAKTIESRCLTLKLIEDFRVAVSKFDFSGIYSINSPEIKWIFFKAVLINILDQVAPVKKVNIRAKNVPWFDKELVLLSKKRSRLYNRARASKLKDNHDWVNFKQANNEFCSKFRKKKGLFYKNLVNENGTSCKKVWKTLSPYINPNKKADLSPIMFENVCFCTSLELASLFARVFKAALVGFVFAESLECCNFLVSFLSCIYRKLPQLIGLDMLVFDPISLTELEEMIKNLDGTSSPGSSGIPTSIIKHSATEIVVPLCHIFNECIKYSYIPDEWKLSYITPVFKNKGSKTCVDNYRPISVISPIAKMFEALIGKRLSNHFEYNQLFNKDQFGFRKNLSCELALNIMIENWRAKLDKKFDVVNIYLDLKKAFDSVDHELLVMKLSYYKISDEAIQLIKCYLSNRNFLVKIKGDKSTNMKLDVGVPQGSVLGPLLFIIFINDMSFLDLKSDCILFADDTTLSFYGKNFEDLNQAIQHDLNLIENWLKFNRLLVNWSKTNAMLIAHSSQARTKLLNQNFNIKFNTHCLSIVNSTKLLGVIIDDKLKFDKHVFEICKKSAMKTKILSRSFSLFDMKFRGILFKLFIVPNFDYCSTLVASTNSIMLQQHNATMTKLVKCYNKSLRVFLSINVTPYFYDLETQIAMLKVFNVKPLILRLFVNYCCFVWNVMKNNNNIASNLKFSCNERTGNYTYGRIESKWGTYSLVKIASNLLNRFLKNHMELNKIQFKALINKNTFTFYNNLSSIFNFSKIT